MKMIAQLRRKSPIFNVFAVTHRIFMGRLRRRIAERKDDLLVAENTAGTRNVCCISAS
jgi:hypothetical protein